MQSEVPPLPIMNHHDLTSNPHDLTSNTHDLTSNTQYPPPSNLYISNPNGANRVKSETGSDRPVSPHRSENSSRYSSQPPQDNLAYQQIASQLSGGIRYPSPSQMQQPNNMGIMPQEYQPTSAPSQPYQPQAQLSAIQAGVQQQEQKSLDASRLSNGGSTLPKSFACSTCAKGFARRSDLARHERIHSGIRPHVCDFEGCGKQFIQRSALTVHARVHTGEKPHMCEKCGKQFSDSSSLARHRRIHSGKRPYKCPFVDCQKTFTRRTTLTRHQGHHTGTIAESAAATAAALATRANQQRRRRSDEEGYSPGTKPSVTSHHDRHGSASPSAGMSGVPGLPRSQSDYYMNAMNGWDASLGHVFH